MKILSTFLVFFMFVAISACGSEDSRSLPDVVQDVVPGVVRIETRLSISGSKTASGSGVIFEVDSKSGSALIMTNYHVVKSGFRISVITNDGQVYKGILKGKDIPRDLAFIEICCEDSLKALEFGNSDEHGPGTDVIKIGYSPGDAPAVTKGIISAYYFDEPSNTWFIQTDAPVNPGDSGGPLLSTSGEVLGINTFIIRGPQGEIEGAGFAISEVTIGAVLGELKDSVTLLATATPTPRPTPTPTLPPTPTPTLTPFPTSTPFSVPATVPCSRSDSRELLVTEESPRSAFTILLRSGDILRYSYNVEPVNANPGIDMLLFDITGGEYLITEGRRASNTGTLLIRDPGRVVMIFRNTFSPRIVMAEYSVNAEEC